MGNLKIEDYNPGRDEAAIRAMVCRNEYFDEMFQESKMNFNDGIFVACYNGLTVGFLSFNGFKRATTTTIFVSKEYRKMGIGTELIKKADKLLLKNEVVERSVGACLDGDHSSLQFLYKNGYYIYHSSYLMEREGEALTESNISVRKYEDDDYIKFHSIREIAFYKMRESVGMLPSYYYAPEELERKSFLEDRNNRYVMFVNDEMAGIGVVDGNEIRQVAVRPDIQSHGFGRAFVSFLVNEIMHRGEKIVKLGVVKGNPAKKLYESLGFREKSLYHQIHKYYRPDSRLSKPPNLDIS